MKRILLTATLAGTLIAGSLATPAEAGWRALSGERVPEFSADEWLNTGTSTPSAASLRGKAYLIEFFATW